MSKKTEKPSQSSAPLLIALLILAGVGYYFFSGSPDETADQEIDTALSPANGQYEGVSYPENSRYSPSGIFSKTEEAQKIKSLPRKKVPGVIDDFQKALIKRKEKHAKVTGEFKQLIHLDLNLPLNMDFSPLDLDEGIAGLRGTGTGEVKDMTILASRKVVKIADIVNYLNSGESGIPAANIGGFRVRKGLNIKPPAGSGIKDITILESDNDSGLKAAFLSRRDQKGNYLFLMKANSSFYENNEGYLELMLQRMKAHQ